MNIGLIGYGFMGGAHAAAIQALPGATLHALASRTHPSADGPTRGNLDLKTVPLPASVQWTPDWHEIVRDPAIDAIDICLPTHMHLEVATAALQHGKHVLCEKPMAMSAADCDKLMAVAKQSGKTLMIAQVLRFMYPYTYALDFVRNAGSCIKSCTLQRSTGYPQWSEWLGNKARSGGAILDLLSHDLDQALLWFGQPNTVSAISIGEVDTAEATLTYDNMQVKVTGGWLAPEVPFSASFHIETTGSTLHFDGTALTLTRNGAHEDINVPQHDAYAAEIAYFVRCTSTGASPDRCPPLDSARVVRLAETLNLSRENNGKEFVWQ